MNGSRFSGKGVQMYKGGGPFADFTSFFLNIPVWNGPCYK